MNLKIHMKFTKLYGKRLLEVIKIDDISKISLFLALGADPNCKDETGETPLHYAAHYGYEHCIQLLLNQGDDIESRDEGGCRPLMQCCIISPNVLNCF